MNMTENDLIFGIVLVAAIALYGIVARICETIQASYLEPENEKDNDDQGT